MHPTTRQTIAVVLATILGFANFSHAADPPVKKLILPGETFVVAGRSAFVLLPPEEKRTKPQPWIMFAFAVPKPRGTQVSFKLRDAGIELRFAAIELIEPLLQVTSELRSLVLQLFLTTSQFLQRSERRFGGRKLRGDQFFCCGERAGGLFASNLVRRVDPQRGNRVILCVTRRRSGS